MTTLTYLHGFGNFLETEALMGALPKHQNSPQKPPLGLYAEQINASAFTVARAKNLHTWFYRVAPSVVQKSSAKMRQDFPLFLSAPLTNDFSPDQMRWSPEPIPSAPVSFLAGIKTFAGNGNVAQQMGGMAHLYACNQSMPPDHYFCNNDGDFLFVPELGRLRFVTEMGVLEIAPLEIAVIPRGIRFRIELIDNEARGYINENYGPPFVLPELGPIGANGLAYPRDFLIPVAAFESAQKPSMLCLKVQGKFFDIDLSHSPCDVVAWHGNYYPYKYDLTKFNVLNTVSFDHTDPSIFTVLTSPSAFPGVANMDFVIFPERWMTAENTFRPPYFHRNIASEFMGLIRGKYDGKPNDFLPGGVRLHNSLMPHGPDAEATRHAIETEKLIPEKYKGTLAFMFETRLFWHPTPYALNTPLRQKDYLQCWGNIPVLFNS